MASKVDICNLALVALGQTTIMSIDQKAPRAEKCAAIFDMVRDIELSSHNWKFATKYQTLAQSSTDPSFTYDNSFQLPSDYLKLVSLDSSSIEYKIVGDKLYTNEDEIGLIYIFRETDTANFSSEFIDLLAARIARDLAWSITNNKSTMVAMYESYTITRRRAIAIDSQQGTPNKVQGTSWITARRY